MTYLKDGAEIYRQSFAIIEAETDLARVPAGLRAAAIRMVHASGQPDLVEDLAWSDGFADAPPPPCGPAPRSCAIRRWWPAA